MKLETVFDKGYASCIPGKQHRPSGSFRKIELDLAGTIRNNRANGKTGREKGISGHWCGHFLSIWSEIAFAGVIVCGWSCGAVLLKEQIVEGDFGLDIVPVGL